MINGLHTAALGAFGQTARLDQISNNLANVNTPGFRREAMTFVERLVEALEDAPDHDHYNAFVDRYGGAPFIEGTHFDRSAGPLQQTDARLDFAIGGSGYFGVVDPRSQERFYTRAGNFTLDPEGYLTTADGRYRVLDDGGEPVQLDLGASGDLFVNRGGQVHRVPAGGGVPEQLSTVGLFDVPAEQLTKFGDTLLRRTEAGLPGQVAAPDVRQGFLEGSSVNPIEEMAGLIETSRLIETNLQMVRFQDATLDRVINTLGRVG